MVDKVEDVVDQITAGWDLKVRDCPVVHSQLAFIPVELQQLGIAAILFKLVFLGENANGSKLIHFDLVQEVPPLTQVINYIPRHSGGEESSRHQLGQSIQGEVSEQAGISQIVLIPMIGVQAGLFILRLVIIQEEQVHGLHGQPARVRELLHPAGEPLLVPRSQLDPPVELGLDDPGDGRVVLSIPAHLGQAFRPPQDVD